MFFYITFEQLMLILYPFFLFLLAWFWYKALLRKKLVQGCSKLGLQGKSNAADEYDPKYDTGTKDKSAWRVKALYIHPIKSCAAVELDIVDVNAEGMVYDRQFVFAELLTPSKSDEAGERRPVWTFRTLRQPGYEKLALVHPEVWVPKDSFASVVNSSSHVEREGRLVIKYPNVPIGLFAPIDRLMQRFGLVPKESSFQVPLNPGQSHDYPLQTLNIWKDHPTWINMGSEVPADFKKWLGVTKPLALFRADPTNLRKLYRNAPREAEVGFQPAIACPDSYPLHLLNIASVHDVGKKITQEIDRLSIRRFRANIVIQGPSAFDEDDWKRCKVGQHNLFCSCHTIRCRLPNVDPDTAYRHRTQPDKVLKSYRCIDPADKLNACLGMQCVPSTNKSFQIRVGDHIEVLERGEHYCIKDNGPDVRPPQQLH